MLIWPHFSRHRKWPWMTFDPRPLSTQATLANRLPYVHMISMSCIACGRYEFLKIFRLRPCIWPLWPQMMSDKKNGLITFVEGLKLYHMHKSHDHAMQSVGGVGILVKITFWPLWPWMTFDPVKSHMTCGLGHWSLWSSFIEINQSNSKVHWIIWLGYMVDRRRRI